MVRRWRSRMSAPAHSHVCCQPPPAGPTTLVTPWCSWPPPAIPAGAVAQAFHGVPGTQVAILYPDGQVSPVQERQFTTLGDNVHAFAVDGTFDDCQRLVKAAFADRDLSRTLGLTSANSINLGRLLPQAVYYVHAIAQLMRSLPGKTPLFVVPSGNFGNLTAGLLGLRLGLHRLGAKFVAATNANDVVPRYLADGIFEPQDSVRTLSNAMDVGDPSNLARIRHFYNDDVEALRRDVRGIVVDDEATREVIARVDRDHGVLLDPHTAVGWHAAERALALEEGDTVAIVLATAHAPPNLPRSSSRLSAAKSSYPSAWRVTFSATSRVCRSVHSSTTCGQRFEPSGPETLETA